MSSRLGSISSKGAGMNPNKALWEKGDFTEIAAFMRQSGEVLVKALGITTPMRILDVGCGDGTTALPLARLGAEVVGIDIAKNLVDAGNKRAAEADLHRLKFQEGDACNLEGISDHSFDLTFGLWGHVCSQALRRWQRVGQGHEARWSDRDGQLDPERSDVLRLAASEDQLIVYASTAGKLRQSDDLGCGEPHHRTLRSGGSAQGEDLDAQGHLLLCVARRRPHRIHRSVQTVLWPDHERLRGS